MPAKFRQYDEALEEARHHLGDDWWRRVDDDLTPGQDAALCSALSAIDRVVAEGE